MVKINNKVDRKQSSNKKFSMPHIYVILFIFGVIATISTYLIPSGEFKRIKGPEGREMVDADSFHYIASSPVGLVDFISIIPRGLIEAGEIVFFTLIIGGMFMVLRRTGIIEIGVDKLARQFINKSILIIPVLTTVFAIIATLIGTAELSLVYIPVIIPLVIALGYDSITATSIALCGTVVGFTVGVLNPINTGLAQKLSGIPTFSGIGLRLVIFIVVLLVTVLFIMKYAKKVKKDPSISLVYEDDTEKRKCTKKLLNMSH
ncbi:MULTISPECIES: hypothetical protein [unclassified Mammaliicoccus]|uniref:hypothetical protein n=2 Tax=unclassified Mammaliicoccus TaxID=2803851 RepID=UPI001EFA3919|nr:MULTISPECIES: hypothetical protein [unclassified Mammaliicoccus]